ncbi:MAG: hypothetical protein JW893_05745, partial [Candidatus Omnitrophica bacterium]|nr:hypothetical protein [Candidatus Omnitrophota bacterium]
AVDTDGDDDIDVQYVYEGEHEVGSLPAHPDQVVTIVSDTLQLIHVDNEPRSSAPDGAFDQTIRAEDTDGDGDIDVQEVYDDFYATLGDLAGIHPDQRVFIVDDDNQIVHVINTDDGSVEQTIHAQDTNGDGLIDLQLVYDGEFMIDTLPAHPVQEVHIIDNENQLIFVDDEPDGTFEQTIHAMNTDEDEDIDVQYVYTGYCSDMADLGTVCPLEQIIYIQDQDAEQLIHDEAKNQTIHVFKHPDDDSIEVQEVYNGIYETVDDLPPEQLIQRIFIINDIEQILQDLVNGITYFRFFDADTEILDYENTYVGIFESELGNSQYRIRQTKVLSINLQIVVDFPGGFVALPVGIEGQTSIVTLGAADGQGNQAILRTEVFAGLPPGAIADLTESVVRNNMTRVKVIVPLAVNQQLEKKYYEYQGTSLVAANRTEITVFDSVTGRVQQIDTYLGINVADNVTGLTHVSTQFYVHPSVVFPGDAGRYANDPSATLIFERIYVQTTDMYSDPLPAHTELTFIDAFGRILRFETYLGVNSAPINASAVSALTLRWVQFNVFVAGSYDHTVIKDLGFVWDQPGTDVHGMIGQTIFYYPSGCQEFYAGVLGDEAGESLEDLGTTGLIHAGSRGC